MTGPMQGADASGLRELARTMQSASTQLDAIRTRTRGRLYAANWQGRDAVDFTRLWEGQLQNLLLRNAQGLSAAAGRLVQEADQQVAASSSGGRGGEAWSGRPSMPAGGNDWLDSLLRTTDMSAFQIGLSVAGFGSSLLDAMSNRVRSYERATGKIVDSYVRWNQGVASSLRALPSANELSRWTKLAKILPFVGPVLVGAQQYQTDRDANRYSYYERGVRVRAAVSGAFAVDVLQGAIVSVGVAGLVVGGPVGLVVAGTMLASYVLIENYDLDQIVGTAFAEGASNVMDFVPEAVDFGREALEGAGELAQEASEAVGRTWDRITPW